MAEADRILRIYNAARRNAEKVKSFRDAQAYAEMLGESLARALNGIDFTALEADEVADMLNPVMRKAYSDAAKAGATIVKMQTRKAGLGLNALTPEYKAEASRTLAEQFAGREVTKDLARNAITKQILSGVDEAIRENAEAHDNMGLKVHIVRTYSDVGLRSGTPYAEPCQWCLDRCGEWDNYADAYHDGAFERHDGCLCEIDYDVGTTHQMSRGKGNWWNK